MSSGGEVRLERRRDALGVELTRARLGPAALSMHMADAVTLVVGIAGSGVVQWRGEAIACAEGTALIVPPLEMIVIRTERTSLEIAMACVPVQLARAGGTAGDLDAAVRWLRGAWLDTERADSEIDFQALAQLLPDAGDARRGRARPGNLEPGPVRRARHHLEKSYRAIATLDELASAVGVSKFHLVRMFRAYHGVPPHAYLIGYRIALARRMLAAGERGADTALATGFADQSHFSRSFRRIMGIAPQDYARLHERSARARSSAPPSHRDVPGGKA